MLLRLLCALVVVALVSATNLDGRLQAQTTEEEVDISHPMRSSNRHEDPLEHELADRASLLFRSMDHDRDKKISEEDVRQSTSQLALHMPGVDVPEFLAFMEMADKDGDKMLSRDELLQGIADGLKEAETAPHDMQQSSLLETGGTTARVARKGFFGTIKKVGGALWKGAKKVVGWATNKVTNAASNAVRRVLGNVDTGADGCVMCQFIVERCESNVKQSGVIPSMSPVAAFDSYLEVDSSAVPDATSLLEVGSKQLYFDKTAAGIIGSTRQSTRVQRQLERQKYNEIYRVVDITLDDVCEQGMPNSFYGYCKQVYKVQSDVVDGLRYQYRPADICFRIGMCGKGSYITRGVHSRYK